MKDVNKQMKKKILIIISHLVIKKMQGNKHTVRYHTMIYWLE